MEVSAASASNQINQSINGVRATGNIYIGAMKFIFILSKILLIISYRAWVNCFQLYKATGSNIRFESTFGNQNKPAHLCIIQTKEKETRLHVKLNRYGNDNEISHYSASSNETLNPGRLKGFLKILLSMGKHEWRGVL